MSLMISKEEPMSELIRFGISLPKKLSDDFDKYITEEEYTNRSEAIRDLISSTIFIV